MCKTWCPWLGSALLVLACFVMPVSAQDDDVAGDAADATTTDDDGFDPGWVGLAGLLGLAGLMRRDRRDTTGHGTTTAGTHR